MIKTTRQKYKDCNWNDVKGKIDCVQLKYDGWWTRYEYESCDVCSKFFMYSQTYRNFLEQACPAIEGITKMTLIGEHMHGTQWAQNPSRKGNGYIHDLLSINGRDLRQATYADRRRLLSSIAELLPANLQLIPCFAAEHRDTLWDDAVVKGEYEGLVYRSMGSTWDSTIYREKKVHSITLIATDFLPANEGKFAGMLGAIIGLDLVTNQTTAVGGGFSTEQLIDIWNRRDYFKGRAFEVQAHAIFESGALRHPNFLHWREDKDKQ